MSAESRKPWFAVKRFGYGVGLPIALEGWLVLLLYVAAMTLSGLLFTPFFFVIAACLSTAAVLYICYVRSDGEWRYRNGE